VRKDGISKRTPRDQIGQDLIEYALLAGLVAAAFAGLGLLFFSDALTGLVNGVAACIDFNSSTSCGM
jgi:Flp pilus assembly pilin Flp